MDGFTVDTDFRSEDLRALEAAALLRSHRLAGRTRRTFTRLVPFGFPILLVAGIALIQGEAARLGWTFGVLAVVLYALVVRFVARRARQSIPGSFYAGRTRFEFSAAGMHVVRRFSEGVTRWP